MCGITRGGGPEPQGSLHPAAFFQYSEALLAGPTQGAAQTLLQGPPSLLHSPLTNPQQLHTEEAEQAPTFLPRKCLLPSALGQGTVSTKVFPCLSLGQQVDTSQRTL